ncbi:MAG: hypothetical protein PHE07_01650 [Bacteroidales bacterium]|nr:hypothetical protein [Bacteroidales bacterium]
MERVDIEQVLKVSEAISQFGILIVIAAVFLVTVFILLITVIARYLKMTGDSVKSQNENMQILIIETREQKAVMESIAEGLTDKTDTQHKVILKCMIDADIERTMRLLRNIRKENNIHDIPAVTEKVHRLIKNLSNKRYEDLSNFSYRGRNLGILLEEGWQSRIAEVVLRELTLDENNGRAYTNVTTTYEDILNNCFRAMKR